MIRELESILEERGFDSEVRRLIRNSRICIVDDMIDELRGMTEGLEKEGFSNIVEKKEVLSVHELLEGNFDIIILDLAGIAEKISKDDGIGVLDRIKEAEPALPILVVSGSLTKPELAKKLSKADLIRDKPVKSSDIARDVEDLLKPQFDKFWGALVILKELKRLHPEFGKNLNWRDRISLFFHKKSIVNKIKNKDYTIGKNIIKIALVTTKLGSMAFRIARISKGFGG